MINETFIKILIILPEDTNKKYMKSVFKKFGSHIKKFRKWGKVSVYGPDPSTDPGYAGLLEEGEYQGRAKKTPILTKLKTMRGADRVIYINDHSNVINSAWTFRDIGGNEDVLWYSELDKYLGGNRAYIILRGSGSGEAIISPSLAKPNRNIYCSMHHREMKGDKDEFDLSDASDPNDLDKKYDDQAMALKQKQQQQSQKWIGIQIKSHIQELLDEI